MIFEGVTDSLVHLKRRDGSTKEKLFTINLFGDCNNNLCHTRLGAKLRRFEIITSRNDVVEMKNHATFSMTLNLILDVKDNHLFNQIMISMWKRIILKESKNKYIERG